MKEEDDDLLLDDDFDDLEEDSEEQEDDKLDDDFDDFDDDLEEEAEQAPAPAQEEPAQVAEEPAPQEVSESMIKAEDVPLDLSIEIGSLRISAQELLQIQAGNVLELPTKAEDGVDLVLNGKVVARGELLRLGEQLGVRILKIS